MKLIGLALEKWNEYLKIYELNHETEALLIALCQAQKRFIETEKMLDEKGDLYKSPSGKLETSPLIGISELAQKAIALKLKALERWRIE